MKIQCKNMAQFYLFFLSNLLKYSFTELSHFLLSKLEKIKRDYPSLRCKSYVNLAFPPFTVISSEYFF